MAALKLNGDTLGDSRLDCAYARETVLPPTH